MLTQLGTATNAELDSTAKDLLDPTRLQKRFEPKGNNGFGNGGEDGTPNGFQDETR